MNNDFKKLLSTIKAKNILLFTPFIVIGLAVVFGMSYLLFTMAFGEYADLWSRALVCLFVWGLISMWILENRK
jgi:hypothetical protein